jgi:sirohydrochlorin ferrochelatase
MTAAGDKQEAKVALVLVDHGSRSALANAALEEAVRLASERSGGRYVAVLPAHMEIASPTIAEAFDAAVAAGATTVVVGLYFLGPGRHSVADVPEEAARAAARHPGLRFVVSGPLGPDEALADLALQRAAEALAAERSHG